MEGGGFCGCRCDGMSVDLTGFTGLKLRVKGDGNRYKLNLKARQASGFRVKVVMCFGTGKRQRICGR